MSDNLKKDFSKCSGCKACVEFIINDDDEGAVASCHNGALRIEDKNEEGSLKGE